MDQLLSPYSSFSPPPPASFFPNARNQVIEFTTCEVPEPWLVDDQFVTRNEDCAQGDDLWPGIFSPASELSEHPPPPEPQQQQQEQIVTAPEQEHRPAKRRGRKPGPRPVGPTVSHVEAERQRRDNLNRRFCELRATVPTVSRMDKASLLADAAAYITQLRSRVAQLEAEAKRASTTRWETVSSSTCGTAAGFVIDEAVEVRMVGPDAAAVRSTSAGLHAPARLMCALQALGLHVQHACISRVHGVTVQDVVVDVPTELQGDDGLRTSLAQRLQDSG